MSGFRASQCTRLLWNAAWLQCGRAPAVDPHMAVHPGPREKPASSENQVDNLYKTSVLPPSAANAAGLQAHRECRASQAGSSSDPVAAHTAASATVGNPDSSTAPQRSADNLVRFTPPPATVMSRSVQPSATAPPGHRVASTSGPV